MNAQQAYLYTVEYKFPKHDPDNQTLIKDRGIIFGDSYSETLRQLTTEVYDEDCVTGIRLYKIPNDTIFSISKDLWNELKEQI